ncbi:serine hydrolase domain-containing protein [Paenibacillus aquistagni]|uniref:serine hydrolase domain-containing protein n=1 Tax=Paenibacillus aquistagni TaxID=1852522 RepID=UPI00145A3F42|nr:serine hydrolase domain-containing protein [Paenibacillus aquistagni]NMM55476.1 beta-lactamase family protein [Paenibacillus aquistagni]
MVYRELLDVISGSAESWMKEEKVPGSALCIMHEGEIAHMQYIGYSDKKSKQPVTEDTLFQVGSISKSVTSWGVMKLAEQQILDLDESIGRYLNGWSFPFSQYDGEKITIRQLLSHMAGINVKSYLGVRNQKNVYSTIESLSGGKYKSTKVGIVQDPGKAYLYSGGGYTILQHIIETVTKMPFDIFMEQEVLQTLGIRGYYKVPQEITHLLAKPYGAFGELQPVYCFSEMSAAGLYMSLRELCKFVSSHLTANNGLIGQRSLDQMFKKARVNVFYGLGYFVRNIQSKHFIFSMGRNRGYFSRFDLFYRDGEAFIILTNSINGSNLTNRLLYPWYTYHLNNSVPNKDALFLNNTRKLTAFLQERMFLLQHLF